MPTMGRDSCYETLTNNCLDPLWACRRPNKHCTMCNHQYEPQDCKDRNKDDDFELFCISQSRATQIPPKLPPDPTHGAYQWQDVGDRSRDGCGRWISLVGCPGQVVPGGSGQIGSQKRLRPSMPPPSTPRARVHQGSQRSKISKL